MFDAKSLLEAMMRGAGPAQQPQTSQPGLGGLGDILGQILQGGGQQSGQAASGGGGLADILAKMMPPAAPGAAPAAGGGLADILAQVQKQLGSAAGTPGAAGASGGGLMDILGQVLGQATSGVKEGAGRLDDMTGATARAREALGQATGQSPEDLLAQLQELIKNNQLGAGAALGGLGGLVLGTRAGRSVAMSAAKLSALALIGGLAYKAFQNYNQGKPPLSAGQAQALTHEAAPSGSGFEPQAISNESATLYIRAMIAAAAADGRIDATEQQKILGGLQQAGLDDAAHSFLRQELQSPATIEDLAGAVTSPAEAVQVYAAARLAVEADNDEEHDFLVALAKRLGVDAGLAKHVDAAAMIAAAA